MTAPTMEQMLDELKRETIRICSRLMHTCYDRHGALMPDAYPIESRPHVGEIRHVVEHIRAFTARFAELERERDEAREGWHMANGVADLAMKHRNRAEALLRKLHPYVDSLICYASTLDEHEGNRIAKDVNDYFADDTIFDAAIAQRAGETG